MIDFVSIIIIVFGILQIILFFKVWGMTNNIRDIKSKLKEKDLYTEARKAYILGDLTKAKTFLDESYAEGIIMIKNASGYGVEYENQFKNLANKYAKVYAKMNLEMPDLSKFDKINTIPM